MSRPAVVACLAVALHAAAAHPNPPLHKTATAGGVRLAGEARSSSVDVPREPRYALSNLTGGARVVELVSLETLGDGPSRALEITGARRIVLAPHATQTVAVEFAGRPVNLGGALSYHRFSLTIAVGGRRAAAIASTAYVCRIPLRRLGAP